MFKFYMNIILLSLLFLISCSKEISPIEYGKDQCDNCKMTISDRKYGAELITKKGKIFKFDAAECMLNFMNAKKADEEDIEKYYVVNLSGPGILTDAITATYLISPKLPSPMGAFISSFTDRNTAEKYLKENGGVIYNWTELKSNFK